MTDFLVVGGRRCGTSFLHHLLRRSAQLWVPPVKELHYFDRPYEGTEWHHAVDRRQAWRNDLKTALREARGIDEYPWAARYLLLPRGDRWYRGLFTGHMRRALITGEITPDYALLPREGIEHVKRVCPDAHIVFLLRDPVERTWSHMKAVGNGGQSPLDMPQREALKLSLRPDIELASQYRMQIENYRRAFGRDKVHVVFFDKLVTAPLTAVEDMSRRVGAGSQTDAFARAGIEDVGKLDATDDSEAPDWLRAMLEKRYRDNVRWIADHVADVPPGWQR